MKTPKNFPILPGTCEDSPVFGTESERFSLADVFGPHFEGAVIPREITIDTEEIRKLIRKDYLFLSKMLHTITRAREYRGVDHPSLNRLEAGIEARIEHVRDLLRIREMDLAKIFNANPGKIPDVVNGRRTKFEAPIASPHAFSYLDLLSQADEFFGHANAAWLQKLVVPQEHNGRVREMKKALYSIKFAVSEARMECFRMLGRLSAQMAPNDPDAAKLNADIKATASGLLNDAKGDSDVMDGLSVSAARDLEAAATSGLAGTAVADEPGAMPTGPDSAATAAESKADAEAKPRKSTRKVNAEATGDVPAGDALA